jgi:uncharacterized iron-regulated membrane protein
VGVVMAGFLIVAGVTGCLLAWNHQLEAVISPELFRASPGTPAARALDPLALRDRVATLYPNASIAYAPLKVEPGHSVWMFLEARTDPATGTTTPLPNDQVFVNPYTGELLGQRKWGDLSQGRKNLMPFVYRLHYTLALGVVGTYAFGIVALLWTIDCFVGAYLSFPARVRSQAASPPKAPGKSWLARWWPSWKVRRRGGNYKVNFDLHRASGLWIWAMLFVIAWSGVAFNLREVYRPVMELAFDFGSGAEIPMLGQPQPDPRISWTQAREQGRRLMAEQARAQSFAVRNETGLGYDASRAVYRYSVNSSRDVRDAGGGTAVIFDANTGGLKQLIAPTGVASGDTITQWLTSLHMAAMWGAPFRAFVSATGLLVALLSVTGTVIWLRKRRARNKSISARRVRGPLVASAAALKSA